MGKNIHNPIKDTTTNSTNPNLRLSGMAKKMQKGHVKSCYRTSEVLLFSEISTQYKASIYNQVLKLNTINEEKYGLIYDKHFQLASILNLGSLGNI